MPDKESSLPEDWFKKGDDEFEEFWEFSQKATAFYFLEHYPFFSEELTMEEVENIYIESLKLIDKIEKSFQQG